MLTRRVPLLVVCFLVLGACSTAEEQARDDFVNDCTDQGAPEAVCACTYGKLEGRYGAISMSRMKDEGPPPDFVEAVVTAAAQCQAGDTSTNLVLPSDEVAIEESAQETTPDVRVPAGGEVEDLVRRYEGMVQGEEERSARIVRTGDVSGNGGPDVVLVFTIESSATNTYQQYLAVIDGTGDTDSFASDVVAVGGSGEEVNDVDINNGTIELHVLTLGPDDPDCCPSVRKVVEYLYHNGNLKRVI